MNIVILLGNVGGDPKPIGNGDSTGAKFSMATTERYTNKKGETVEETEWTDILCFGATGKYVLAHLKKGDMVTVRGQKKTRTYDKDGVKHQITEIRANEVRGPRRDGKDN